MFEVNSKDTRTMSMTLIWCLYCLLSKDFAHSSGVSIGNFEQVSVGSVDKLQNGIYFGPELTCNFELR